MMRQFIRRLMPLAAVAAFVATPSQLRADDPSCTEDYLVCVAEAAALYDDFGDQHFDIVDDVAYLECAAGWIGCVRAKLLW